MFWVVFFTVELLSAVISVVVGNCGISLPLMQVCAFYFCVKTTLWKATPLILLFAALLDALWLHPLPAQLLSIGVVILFSVWWRRFGDLYAWTALCGAALVCGFCAWLAQVTVSSGTSASIARGGISLLGQLFAAVVLTSGVVFVMERILVRRVHTGLREVSEEE